MRLKGFCQQELTNMWEAGCFAEVLAGLTQESFKPKRCRSHQLKADRNCLEPLSTDVIFAPFPNIPRDKQGYCLWLKLFRGVPGEFCFNYGRKPKTQPWDQPLLQPELLLPSLLPLKGLGATWLTDLKSHLSKH